MLATPFPGQRSLSHCDSGVDNLTIGLLQCALCRAFLEIGLEAAASAECYGHITPELRELQWLPISGHAFKVFLLTYNLGLGYLKDHLPLSRPESYLDHLRKFYLWHCILHHRVCFSIAFSLAFRGFCVCS